MEFHSCPRPHAQEETITTGSILCARCIRQVDRNLRALPGLHQECLHHMSSATRRMNNPTKVSGSRKRDHLDISALDTRYNILAVLESWSEIVVEEFTIAPPTRSVPHLARFLIRHLKWLTAQPPAADFADEIDSLHTELLSTIDPDPSHRHALISECVVDGCAGRISVSPQDIRNSRVHSIDCSAGHSWEMSKWLLLRQLMNRKQRDAA